jgi:hypothetical protein
MVMINLIISFANFYAITSDSMVMINLIISFANFYAITSESILIIVGINI